MSSKVTQLDIRDDIRRGQEPFSKIMGAVASLQSDEQLLLVAPFEPKPLFGVLKEQGFSHSARQMAGGDWEVLFTRNLTSAGAKPAGGAAPGRADLRPPAAQCVGVDARGLEPPQPLVTILEALSVLPKDAEMLAHTDRRPMHLYAQLEERGFFGETQEQPDGSFITHIRRS